jgi:hypothetical protein
MKSHVLNTYSEFPFFAFLDFSELEKSVSYVSSMMSGNSSPPLGTIQ